MLKIGQGEVVDLFEERKGEEFTSTEVADLMEKSSIAIKRIIRCLLKDKTFDLHKRELTYEEKIEKYGRNINTRIFVYYLN